MKQGIFKIGEMGKIGVTGRARRFERSFDSNGRTDGAKRRATNRPNEKRDDGKTPAVETPPFLFYPKRVERQGGPDGRREGNASPFGAILPIMSPPRFRRPVDVAAPRRRFGRSRWFCRF